MEYYRNLSGGSGIRAYEISQTQITIQFTSGGIYVYDYISTGVDNIEYMKSLAIKGRGLNSYIVTRVKKNFARRIR